MAAVHVGVIPQSCDKCQRDPSLKCAWGCEKPLQTAVEVIPDDENNRHEYYSCPITFISPRCYDFYTKYTMLKQNLVSPNPYETEDTWFIEASGYYEKWYNTYQSKKRQVLNG